MVHKYRNSTILKVFLSPHFKNLYRCMDKIYGAVNNIKNESLKIYVKTINNKELLISARQQENVSIHLKDKDIIKEIVVPERLVNFVVK